MKRSLLRQGWILLSAYTIGFYASTINRFRVSGIDHIPASRGRGILLIANHTSSYDTLFLPWAVLRRFPRQMIWAPAKEDLFRNPLLGWLIGSWGAFPVEKGIALRAYWQIETLLRTQMVMLFPEGIRRRDGKLGTAKRALGKLIYDTHPIVIPVALSGLNSWQLCDFQQPARAVVGSSIDFSDLYRSQNCRATHALIVDRAMRSIAKLLTTDPGNPDPP